MWVVDQSCICMLA